MYNNIIGAIRHEHCCARINEVSAEYDLDENAKQRHMNYAKEHYQVEEWLKELKAIKENAVFYSNRPIEDIVLAAKADAEKEYLVNTYGLTIKIAEAEKQKIRTDAINECINILNDSIPLVDNMDLTFGFKCAIERLRLKQLEEEKND